MLGYGYYSGEFSALDEVRIPLTDRSYFFGDAVYEVCIGGNGKIYQLREHTERLKSSLSAVKIALPEDFGKLSEIALELIRKLDFSTYILYVQIGREAETRQHCPAPLCGSKMLVAVFPSEKPKREDVTLITESDRRYCYCNVKTVNLLPAVLSSARAEEHGADETLYIRDGYVTECSHSNIMILKDGVLIAPPPSPSVLPGITRATVLRIAASLGIPVKEEFFTEGELLDADEVFISSTTKLLRRVKTIDGRETSKKCGDIYGEITDALIKELNDACF